MKNLLIIALISMLCFAAGEKVMAEPVADAISVEYVLADDVAMAEVQPFDLQISQDGDSIIIVANGQRSAFYVKADSKAGKAFGIIGVITAILLSIIAMVRQYNFKHRLSDLK